MAKSLDDIYDLLEKFLKKTGSKSGGSGSGSSFGSSEPKRDGVYSDDEIRKLANDATRDGYNFEKSKEIERELEKRKKALEELRDELKGLAVDSDEYKEKLREVQDAEDAASSALAHGSAKFLTDLYKSTKEFVNFFTSSVLA